MNFQEASMEVLRRFSEYIRKTGRALCMSCLKEFPSANCGAISLYVPKEALEKEKGKITAYAICADCMKKHGPEMADRVEKNLMHQKSIARRLEN